MKNKPAPIFPKDMYLFLRAEAAVYRFTMKLNRFTCTVMKRSSFISFTSLMFLITLTQEETQINCRGSYRSRKFLEKWKGQDLGGWERHTADIFNSVPTVTKHLKSINAN